ncbi:acyl carrier protein [Actinomadura rifamycini]|uniref:acyl carrier protein n=1 Tax=Actinomadura rifamycini TaxID=31962 RepID=UPI0003FFCBDE|nr:phosphopantetheine-binding protein [Actinomadura rifamycini]
MTNEFDAEAPERAPEDGPDAETGAEVDEAEVDEVVRVLTDDLVVVLGAEPPDAPIGPGSTFFEDIGLESIEFAALAGRIRARHGDRVDLTEIVADLDVDEFADLTVADLARHIAVARHAPAGEDADG